MRPLPSLRTQVKLITLPALPPTSQKSPSSVQELLLARERHKGWRGGGGMGAHVPRHELGGGHKCVPLGGGHVAGPPVPLTVLVGVVEPQHRRCCSSPACLAQ